MKKQDNMRDEAVLTVDAEKCNWSPNRVFTGTHDEFMEHIHKIEAGEFMSLEEFEKEHAVWKMEFLKNLSK